MRILQVVPGSDPELARTLLEIQHAAYALEASLILDDRIPALHEDVDDLRSAQLLWLAALVDGRLVGAVGWSENEEELDVDRLVVAPDMHRHGVGSALVRAVLQRAGKAADRRIDWLQEHPRQDHVRASGIRARRRRGGHPGAVGDAVQVDRGLRTAVSAV